MNWSLAFTIAAGIWLFALSAGVVLLIVMVGVRFRPSDYTGWWVLAFLAIIVGLVILNNFGPDWWPLR